MQNKIAAVRHETCFGNGEGGDDNDADADHADDSDVDVVDRSDGNTAAANSYIILAPQLIVLESFSDSRVSYEYLPLSVQTISYLRCCHLGCQPRALNPRTLFVTKTMLLLLPGLFI